ncbi:hypothetical protein WL279_12820, partial [Staphylococcus epidermidis]
MVQASGGALSSSQQKILEFLTALSIAVSLSQMVEEEIQQLRKLYADMKKLFKKIGKMPRSLEARWENIFPMEKS